MTDVTGLRSAAVGTPNKVDITPVIEVIMVSAAELADMRYVAAGAGMAAGCQGLRSVEATLVRGLAMLGMAGLRRKGLSGARLRIGQNGSLLRQRLGLRVRQGRSLLRQRLRIGLALRASGIMIFSVSQRLRVTLRCRLEVSRLHLLRTIMTLREVTALLIAQLVAALKIPPVVVLRTGVEIGRLILALSCRLLALIIILRLLMSRSLALALGRRRGRVVTLALRGRRGIVALTLGRRGRVVTLTGSGLTGRNALTGTMLTRGGLALLGIGPLLGRSFPFGRGAALQCHY